MNLVQINERLKDLPPQVLQQYANGMNPEVPPYLALGELQRREIAEKKMATAQGGQQGPQPSIKEQVEQKAGLMAFQQMQQQQMAQQMQQPRGPMPTPAGIPQPEAQPEAMMARGGLAGIPVRRDMFEYAGGGIIAFQSGGQSLNERSARQMEEKGSIYDPFFGLPAQERERMKQEATLKAAQDRASQSMAVTESSAQALVEGAQTRVNELESNREALIRQYGARQYEQALAKAKQAIDAASSRGSDLMAKQSQMGQSMLAEATPPPPPASPISRPATQMTPQQMEAKMPSGLPAALQKVAPSAADRPAAPMPGPTAPPAPGAQRPPSPAPAGAPAGIAGALPQGNVSPFMAEAAAAAREKPVAPTPESIIAEQKKLLPESMQEDAVKKMIADQRARAEGRQAAYEKSKPSGLDDLIRVYGQAAQYKGGTGLAPAYTSLQQQRRAEDLAMQKQQDELLTAIEGRQYGADKELFGAREKSLTAAQKSYQERLMTNTKALADLVKVDQDRISDVARNLNQMQIAKLQAATANRPTEVERIEAQYMGLLAKGKTQEAEEYLSRISRIKGGGTAGVGADNAETRRLREAMKDIDARLEFMDADNPEYKTLQATRDRLSKRVVERAIGEAGGVGAPSGVIDKSNPLLK